MSAADLSVAGFVPYSSCDWPGKLAATLFLQGCPWACTYCHNPSLQNPRQHGAIRWSKIAETLRRRQGMLDGVVFSGGEPTQQLALKDGVKAVRDLGFLAAIHTAGAYPERLREILPMLTWVGFDIKATPEGYGKVAGVEAAGGKAWKSLTYVQRAGVDYEVRVSVDPTVHTTADIEAIADELTQRGARPPILQEVRPDGTNPDYAAKLGDKRLTDVVPGNVLTHLKRREVTPPVC